MDKDSEKQKKSIHDYVYLGGYRRKTIYQKEWDSLKDCYWYGNKQGFTCGFVHWNGYISLGFVHVSSLCF